MDPTAPIIKQITQSIEKNMQELSKKLENKYGAVLQRIDNKRFTSFQQCLKQKSDIPQCYGSTQKFHVNVEFWKANKEFQDCIQTITTDYFDPKIKKNQNFIENKVSSCTLKYESVVVLDMQNQIKRLGKFL